MKFQTMSHASGSVHIGPSLRNRIPILLRLKSWLEPEGEGASLSGSALDLSAGTGAHLEVMAPGFPSLEWTATEYVPPGFDRSSRPSALDVIDSFSLGIHANVRASLPLDLSAPFSAWHEKLQEMRGKVRLVLNCNVIHITPWRVTEGLFRGAAELLRDDGTLAIYGPFAENGVYSSDGNRNFNASLRSRDPEWGIRDLNRVVPLANSLGLELVKRFAMPANNLLLLFSPKNS